MMLSLQWVEYMKQQVRRWGLEELHFPLSSLIHLRKLWPTLPRLCALPGLEVMLPKERNASTRQTAKDPLNLALRLPLKYYGLLLSRRRQGRITFTVLVGQSIWIMKRMQDCCHTITSKSS